MYLNCVSLFIGTERARRSTVQKKKKKKRERNEGVKVGSQAVSGHLAPEVSFSRSWMPSLSIKRTLKEGRFRMKRLFSWRREKETRSVQINAQISRMDVETSTNIVNRKIKKEKQSDKKG